MECHSPMCGQSSLLLTLFSLPCISGTSGPWTYFLGLAIPVLPWKVNSTGHHADFPGSVLRGTNKGGSSKSSRGTRSPEGHTQCIPTHRWGLQPGLGTFQTTPPLGIMCGWKKPAPSWAIPQDRYLQGGRSSHKDYCS